MTEEVMNEVEEFDLDIELDEAQTEVEPVQEVPTSFKLKYKDKEYDLPKELENKVIPLDEYTRKTQVLAEERKQLETMKAELAQARAKQIEYDEVVVEKTYKVKANEKLLDEYENLDWDKFFNEQPTEAAKHQFKMQQLKTEQHKLVKEIVTYNQSKQESYHQTYAKEVEQELVKLYEVIPDWDKQAPVIAEYARGVGFKDEEFTATTDHRALRVLRDAAKWNQYQAAKQAKQQGSVPVVKSQGKSVSKAGSVDTLSDADYFRSIFKK